MGGFSPLLPLRRLPTPAIDPTSAVVQLVKELFISEAFVTPEP